VRLVGVVFWVVWLGCLGLGNCHVIRCPCLAGLLDLLWPPWERIVGKPERFFCARRSSLSVPEEIFRVVFFSPMLPPFLRWPSTTLVSCAVQTQLILTTIRFPGPPGPKHLCPFFLFCNLRNGNTPLQAPSPYRVLLSGTFPSPRSFKGFPYRFPFPNWL